MAATLRSWMLTSVPPPICFCKIFHARRVREQGPKKKGVGPLVSSREERALFVPRISCLSTAYQPPVNQSLCSSNGLHGNFLVRASGEPFRWCVDNALERTGDACLLGKLFCRRPVLPGLALPPCRAPRPDPPVVCPDFGFDN